MLRAIACAPQAARASSRAADSAPRANQHFRARMRQRKGSRARRAARAENQHSAVLQMQFAIQRPQARPDNPYSNRAISRFSPTTTVFTAPIFSAIGSHSARYFMMACLCGNGDAESAQPEFRNRPSQILPDLRTRNGRYTASRFVGNETGVVQQRRKRMPDRISNHSINFRLARNGIRAIQGV